MIGQATLLGQRGLYCLVFDHWWNCSGHVSRENWRGFLSVVVGFPTGTAYQSFSDRFKYDFVIGRFMDVLLVFVIIAAIILLGFLGEWVFDRTRIPDVLILILIGIGIGLFSSIGPTTFEPWTSVFTTFTLVFLLFQGALSISFKKLFSSLRRALVLTLVSFVLTVLAVTGGAMLLFGFKFLTALLLGMILGGTSSAVIIPMVRGLKLPDKYGVVLTLESAISDVFTIIGAVTVIGVISTGAVAGASIFNSVFSSFALALVLGGLAGVAWAFVLARFPRVNTSYMLTIAVIILVYAFTESPFIGASGAIAALVFGLVLGNAKGIMHSLKKLGARISEEDVKKRVLTNSALSFYSEIGFFVKVFFFVYLGLLIDFSQAGLFFLAVLLTVVLYLVRPVAVFAAFFSDRVSEEAKVALETLIPKGLAAAVLAQLAIQEGVPGAETMGAVVLAVILVSIVLTSVLIFLNRQGRFNGVYRWKT